MRRRHCQIYPSGSYSSAIFVAVFPLTPFAPLRRRKPVFRLAQDRRHRQNLLNPPCDECLTKMRHGLSNVEQSYLLSSSVLKIFSLELQNSECIAMMHHELPMLKPTPSANDLLSVVRLVGNVRFIVLAISHLPITHSAGSSQFRQLPLASTHASEEER